MSGFSMENSSDLKTRRLHTILLTKDVSKDSLGGPPLMVRVLLKGFEETNKKLTVSAVYFDRIVHSYKELETFDKDVLSNGNLKKREHIPRFLRLCFEFVRSIPMLLYNIGNELAAHKNSSVIFHANDLLSAFVCQLCYGRKYPIIISIHHKGGWVRDLLNQIPVTFRRGPLPIVMGYIERKAIEQAEIVTFPSKGAQDLFEIANPGLLSNKDVRIVYNGIDFRQFDQIPNDPLFLTKFGVDSTYPLILCVSKLVEDKGVTDLILAIELLVKSVPFKFSCVIVGRGPLKETLEKTIHDKKLQDTILIVDYLDRLDLLKFLNAASVFVIPSVVAVFDIALLEAGAMKLPIVTTAVGGNLEMFDSNSAILVPPENPQVVAQSIARLLNNQAERERYAENAYRRIRTEFTMSKMLDSYYELYREVTKEI